MLKPTLLYKHLVRAFFAEFMRLFAPNTAAGIDLSTLRFRDAEVFTDIPQGERRTADVVVEVRTKDGKAELVIVHIEIQRKRERDFNRRMWEYFAALHLRENVPIIPIALVFYPAREGIGREGYEVAAFGRTIMSFNYLQISLPRLRAEDYVATDNLLGAALTTEMQLPPSREARVALLRRALQRIQNAQQNGELDDVRAFFLGNLIFSYFDGHIEDQEELRVQLGREGEDELMQATDLTWAGRIDLEATLRTQRKAIENIVVARFGQISPDVRALIDETQDEDGLEALISRAATAQSERDLLQAFHQL